MSVALLSCSQPTREEDTMNGKQKRADAMRPVLRSSLMQNYGRPLSHLKQAHTPNSAEFIKTFVEFHQRQLVSSRIKSALKFLLHYSRHPLPYTRTDTQRVSKQQRQVGSSVLLFVSTRLQPVFEMSRAWDHRYYKCRAHQYGTNIATIYTKKITDFLWKYIKKSF